MQRSVSQVHDGRGITGSTNYKEEAIRKARQLDTMEADAEKQFIAGEAYSAGSNEGFRAGFKDLEQRLAASNLYSSNMPQETYVESQKRQDLEFLRKYDMPEHGVTGLVEGSPAAIAMDENMARRANYGLLDEVEGLMGTPVQQKQQVHTNDSSFGEAAKAGLMESIQNIAIDQAVEQGDTSSENINKIMAPMLQREGL